MDIFTGLSGPIIYFSRIQGAKIYDHKGNLLGRFQDFLVDLEDIFPQVLGIVFKGKSKQTHSLAWVDIQTFTDNEIHLMPEAMIYQGRGVPWSVLKTPDGPVPEQDLVPLGKLILDRQIVDTQGKKVIRVTDIHLIKVGTRLRVTHASVGPKAILRRLGFWRFLEKLITQLYPSSSILHLETLISWRYVHALPNQKVGEHLKLNTSGEIFESFHPADLADILEELDGHSRGELFKQLDLETAAETLSEVDENIQTQIIQGQDPERAADILEHMDPDDAADIISELSGKDAIKIFANIDDDEVQEGLQELLFHEEDSAGGLMSTAYFQALPEHTGQDILDLIRQKSDNFESIYTVYVLNKESRFIGVCTLREILSAGLDIPVRDIMRREDLKVAFPDWNWREIMSVMYKYNLSIIPVVKETDWEMLGIVTLDDLLPYVWKE